MRIQNKKVDKNLRSRDGKSSASAKIERNSSLQHNFQDVLQERNFVLGQERLTLFLDSLDEMGERLVKTFSIYDLLAYKEMLRSFLDETLQQVYGLKEETGWSGTGRPKLYQRIELLDQEMESLTKIVLEKQKDPVKLLKKLDSIRGLLVDLYS
ncbi:MAG: YaaR family protein [Paludibacteraceae bacterium]|jgi:uncharacterized protein YaaR (DUF327 family)|nr:YaaR family protein [Clostridia bacterium]MDD4146663.1 YaaR family protein [Clostridia bacterium]